MQTTGDRIIAGAISVPDHLRQKTKDLIFKIFIKKAQQAHPFGDEPSWADWRNGLVAQYPDGGFFGDSRLSRAYRALI